MRKKKDTHSFDFRPLGLAIREAREKAGLSRNDLGDKVFYGEQMCIRDSYNTSFKLSTLTFKNASAFLLQAARHLTSDTILFCRKMSVSYTHLIGLGLSQVNIKKSKEQNS